MQNRSVEGMDVQSSSGIVRDQEMFFSDPIGMTAGLQQGFEAGVQFVDAGEIVQNALVDPQRSGGDAVAGFELHQVEATQRRRWRQRAPVRLIEHGKRKRKRDGSATVVPSKTEGFTALRGKGRVHLDACAKQQDLAFEGAQCEGFSDLVDGRWRIERLALLMR